MDPVELYQLLGRQPFQPLRVVLKDGRQYDIASRHFAVVGVDYLRIGFQAEGYDEGVCARVISVDLQDVVGVEPLGAPPTKAIS